MSLLILANSANNVISASEKAIVVFRKLKHSRGSSVEVGGSCHHVQPAVNGGGSSEEAERHLIHEVGRLVRWMVLVAVWRWQMGRMRWVLVMWRREPVLRWRSVSGRESVAGWTRGRSGVRARRTSVIVALVEAFVVALIGGRRVWRVVAVFAAVVVVALLGLVKVPWVRLVRRRQRRRGTSVLVAFVVAPDSSTSSSTSSSTARPVGGGRVTGVGGGQGTGVGGGRGS